MDILTGKVKEPKKKLFRMKSHRTQAPQSQMTQRVLPHYQKLKKVPTVQRLTKMKFYEDFTISSPLKDPASFS